MNFSRLENFLLNNISKMPLWVRVTSYLVLLALFVYTSLLPEFVDGEIRISNEDGSYIYYTLGEVSMVVDGKEISTRLNDKGRWSLPVLEKIPKDKTISIKYTTRERTQRNFDIILKKSYFLSSRLVVVYHNPDSDQKFYLAEPEDSRGAKVFDQLLELIAPRISYAGVSPSERDRVNSIVNELAAEQTKDSTVNIFEKYNLDSKDEILLKEAVEEKHKIKIPAQDWLNIKTSNDLDAVISTEQEKTQVKVGTEIGYAYYGIQNNDSTWKERFFDNTSRNPAGRPQVGDVVKATGQVNIRNGYIEYSFFRGWLNKKIIGLIKPGDKLLIDEVKSAAGADVWIRFRRIIE